MCQEAMRTRFDSSENQQIGKVASLSAQPLSFVNRALKSSESNFSELRKAEVRRTPPPRGWVNSAHPSVRIHPNPEALRNVRKRGRSLPNSRDALIGAR